MSPWRKHASGPPCLEPPLLTKRRSSSVSRALDIANTKPDQATVEQEKERSPRARQTLFIDNARFLDSSPSPHLGLGRDSPRRSPLQRTASCPTKPKRMSSAPASERRKSMHPARVQRWCGLTRTVSDWDGLRRDSELWYPDGECYVHLSEKGSSRRGPSFCVPYRVLRQKKCTTFVQQCEAQSKSKGSQPQHGRRLPNSLEMHGRKGSFELFIPTPEGTSRENAFDWHITTRNFFAFVLGRPLVGEHMGQAFVDLQERMRVIRPSSNNHQEFLEYADTQGYRDFTECTDYALAMLFYAEHYKLRDVWIDAFAHCVGMNDSLALSPEYACTSRLTKALITRAYLEVDLHLNRVGTAIKTFLEEDLSPAYLGLTPVARNHIDRFRKFLHHFYLEKFGKWPPTRGVAFPKALYKSMFDDFQRLYNYLVDKDSSTDISLQKPASGGICVLQNIANFDQRHNFTAQAHPLPLLPIYTSRSRKSDSQKALRQMTLASQHNKNHEHLSMTAALAVATNNLDKDAMESRIIQAFMHFERSYPLEPSHREERISLVDARKVRWILIYGLLQHLASALRAPPEVRDTETPDYPLCCLVASKTTPKDNIQVATPAALTSPSPQTVGNLQNKVQDSPCSIEPDCSREDYFSPKPRGRRNSVESSSQLKGNPPSRSSSVRSFGPLSMSGRTARRNSLTLKPPQHCAILVQGYGNGLNEATTCPPSPPSPTSGSTLHAEPPTSLQNEVGPETSWLRPKTPSATHSREPSSTMEDSVPRPRTPLLESIQLDIPVENVPCKAATPTEAPSRSDSTSSTCSSVWSEKNSATSSKSSTDDEYFAVYQVSAAEHSGLLGGLVCVDNLPAEPSRPTSFLSRAATIQSHIHPLLRRTATGSSKFEPIERVQSPQDSESSETTIGMAVSTCPSPAMKPLPDSRPASSSSSFPPLRPALIQRTVTAPVLSTRTSLAKMDDPSNASAANVSTSATTQPSEAPEPLSRQVSAPKTVRFEQTPTITMTSHGRKSSPIQISTTDCTKEAAKKKTNRLSSFWRRR